MQTLFLTWLPHAFFFKGLQLLEERNFFPLFLAIEHIEHSTELHSSRINLGSLLAPEPIPVAKGHGATLVSLHQAGLIWGGEGEKKSYPDHVADRQWTRGSSK